MKILLVEDSSEKKDLKMLLSEEDHNITNVQTVMEAMRVMAYTKFDLVITDMQIPLDLKEEVDIRGGLILYERIMESDTIFQPKGTIAITEYIETNNIIEECNNAGLQIINYEISDDKWMIYLDRALKKYENKNKVDVVIVTAVTTEFEEAKAVFKGVVNDDGCFITELDNRLKVLVCSPLNMGLITITEYVAKIIIKYEPEMLIMTGKAAGLGKKDSKDFCDILVAESAWDYSSLTIFDNDKEDDFIVQYSSDPIKIDIKLAKIFKGYLTNKELCSRLRNNVYNKDINIHVGPFASGTAVIKSHFYIEKVIAPLNKKFIGLDMETVGFYYAALNSEKQPYFISIKCLSDWGDLDKNESHQKQCSIISARLALYFLENDYINFIRERKK